VIGGSGACPQVYLELVMITINRVTISSVLVVYGQYLVFKVKY